MNKSVKVGDIEFPFIGMSEDKDERNQQEMFAVPGGFTITGRGNAERAAKALINSNEPLRVKRRGF
jgi:hypothetical protein